MHGHKKLILDTSSFDKVRLLDTKKTLNLNLSKRARTSVGSCRGHDGHGHPVDELIPGMASVATAVPGCEGTVDAGHGHMGWKQEVKAWISNCKCIKEGDMITHTFYNFNGGLKLDLDVCVKYNHPWASCQIRKIAGCTCAGNVCPATAG